MKTILIIGAGPGGIFAAYELRRLIEMACGAALEVSDKVTSSAHTIEFRVSDDKTSKTSGAVDYFIEQQKLGKIKYLGFSSHASTATLERFASYRQWDFAQLQINYYDWMYGSTKKEYEILEIKYE